MRPVVAVLGLPQRRAVFGIESVHVILVRRAQGDERIVGITQVEHPASLAEVVVVLPSFLARLQIKADEVLIGGQLLPEPARLGRPGIETAPLDQIDLAASHGERSRGMATKTGTASTSTKALATSACSGRGLDRSSDGGCLPPSTRPVSRMRITSG